MNVNLKLLYWLPRVLGILSIMFITMFALDADIAGKPLAEQALGLLQHLTPSIVLSLVLLTAWKWEKIGGLLFLLIGTGLIPFVYMLNHNRNHFSFGQSLLVILIINVPFVLVGALFLASNARRQKINLTSQH